MKGCMFEGCTRVLYAQDMCHAHYERERRNGTLVLLPTYTVQERLKAQLVRMPNGCLEWTGGTNAWGYGVLNVDRVPRRTHRLAWELVNGPIPDGLMVCHRCDNPPCCDVEGHLFLGTNTDNMQDMIAKGRAPWQQITHCLRGHLYDEGNTYVTPRGHRVCRACKRLRAKRAAA